MKDTLIKKEDVNVSMNVMVMDIGYQADIYIDGQPVAQVVRDFGGSYNKRKLKVFKQELAGALISALDKWRGDK